jgi:hypothetical protein
MGILGDILSLPVKIANAPVKAVETLVGAEDADLPQPSKILEALSDELEEVDE